VPDIMSWRVIYFIHVLVGVKKRAADDQKTVRCDVLG